MILLCGLHPLSPHFDAVGLSLGSTIQYGLDTVPNTVGGNKNKWLPKKPLYSDVPVVTLELLMHYSSRLGDIGR